MDIKTDMREISDKELMEMAISAGENSYSPYSGFSVGAALLSRDGKVFTGCNIENAAFTPSICAERTAFSKAVSEGVRDFVKIAIAGRSSAYKKTADSTDVENETEFNLGWKGISDFTAPCGVCRQVMMEFCSPDEFKIILGNSKGQLRTFLLSELLPMGFGPGDF